MQLRLGLSLGLALALAIPPAAHALIDLVGQDQAHFTWTPASGPVVGYRVYVARNGGAETLESVVAGTGQTVGGQYGDTVVVRVAATDADGNEGPLSPASEAVHFVANAPPPPSEPAPQDFDGDGFSDFQLTDPSTGRAQLWSLDASGFVLLSELPALPADWSIVATPDTNGDGTADVLWRDAATGRLDIWLIVDGRLVGGDMVRGPEGNDWVVATTGDFDADGREDLLLWRPASGDLELWLMQGTQVAQIVAWAAGPTAAAGWSAEGGGDYDGDGVHDVLWRQAAQGRLESWLVRSPQEVVQAVFDDALDPAWSVEGSGDADGDGDEEVWLLDRALAQLEARGLDGTQLWYPTPDAESEVEALGDYDGDGRGDVLWRYADGSGFALFSSADGWVELGDPWAPAAGTGDPASTFCTGDLDGDGQIGMSDFTALRRCYGSTDITKCSRADLDGDGVVGVHDLNLFRSRFGTTCGG